MCIGCGMYVGEYECEFVWCVSACGVQRTMSGGCDFPNVGTGNLSPLEE